MKRRSNKITLYNNVYSQYKPPNNSPNNSSLGSGSAGDLLMYRCTYASRMTLVMVFMLCISLLIQPISSAHAQETEVDTASLPEAEEVSVTADITEIEEGAEVLESAEDSTGASDAEPLDPVVSANDETGNDLVDPTDPEVDLGEDDSAGEPLLDVAASTSDSVESEQSEADLESELTTVTDQMATTTSTSTDQTVDDSVVSDDSGDDSTDESGVPTNEQEQDQNDDESESDQEESGDGSLESENENASTSDPVSESTVQEISVLNSDQAIAFDRNECTEVDDGSFYCQKVSSERVSEDALFAAPDNTGDMEIYVVQDGVETKLTNNVLEDASPYFDSRSDTIVWHRLINDRYQIISYDIDAQEETQLTDTRVNNMEPTKSGDYTVWQRWVVDNWEIILFDGVTQTQLTDSKKHDIAPNIYGDMIIWNVRSSDGTQSLMTYEISTETFNQIADTEGVTVSNPRMLVTYEAQYQNGDSVLKGFDLVTGEIVPIEHLPRELPKDLPEPDATGETRALPTGTNDEEELEQEEPEPENDPVPAAASSTAPVSVSTTTVEVSPDLDLRPVDAPVATTTDLVVEQAAIPDVIVPEFQAISSEDSASSTQDV